MVVEFRQQKKKQRNLLIVGIIVILITVGVLYFGFLQDKTVGIIEIEPANSIKEVTIDTTVFENPFFAEDKPFEEVPAFEGSIGRENPLTPF